MNNVLSSIKNYFIIVLSFLLVLCGIELPFGLPRDAVTDAENVRIMSFNIRYGEYDSRATIIPEVIADYKPDSVGIQECTFDWAITLGTLLDGYSFVGVGRDTGSMSADCGEMSAVLYRTDKYELVDHGTFWLSQTPNKVSFGWDAVCRRICTWVILKNKETGEQYAHVNTHLDHEGDEARKNGTQMVVDFALSFDMPTVVTGDFNYSKGCDYYNGIISSGLFDTQDLAPDTMNGKTYHGYNGGEEGTPIDFIFVNNKVSQVLKYRIMRTKYYGQYTSDHYPIYADMKL
ncbi:MAG: endonuclease/exonuclease/phosphatase family protein [Ruminococcaceae bacterium]|nr:endonuclease/exonuclease/phosphatase family protein [Oscillospiraceae bacterium]MBR3597544.1 endonuclease/exonuclease/phosphatase family protein [Clostridia bacterium]